MPRYLFYPIVSRQQQRCRLLGTALLVASLLLWPTPVPGLLTLAQWALCLALLVWLGRSRRGRPRPFALAPDGQGQWLNDGSLFRLTPACRLLPAMVVLRITPGQWLWCHRDSFERADWHRLCRLALAAQCGESTVGPEDGSGSG